MKSYLILSAAAIAAGSIFSSEHLTPDDTENLVARMIDPKSMDPTRLSVLSVLKTAIPCSAYYPESTGNTEEWYSKLPADVKTLLPSLYPVSSTVSTTVSASDSHSSNAAMPTSIAKLAVSDVFTAACSMSKTTVTTQLTITKTVHYTPSGTAASNSSRVLVASNGTIGISNSSYAVPSPTNGTVGPTSSLFTGGAEKVLGGETMAAFAWVGLAAAFMLFA